MPTKFQRIKAMVFPVVMCACENCTIKKAKCWRINNFELSCWRRLMRVPWKARRSTLNIHWKDCCWSWSSKTLATWCKELTQKTLMLGKIGGKRRRGWNRMRWLNRITDSMHMNLRKLLEIVKDRGAWHAAVYGVTKNQTRLSE